MRRSPYWISSSPPCWSWPKVSCAKSRIAVNMLLTRSELSSPAEEAGCSRERCNNSSPLSRCTRNSSTTWKGNASRKASSASDTPRPCPEPPQVVSRAERRPHPAINRAGQVANRFRDRAGDELSDDRVQRLDHLGAVFAHLPPNRIAQDRTDCGNQRLVITGAVLHFGDACLQQPHVLPIRARDDGAQIIQQRVVDPAGLRPCLLCRVHNGQPDCSRPWRRSDRLPPLLT